MIEPNLAIIAALDRNRLIGRQNRMPWHIPEDLAWFREKTLDHTVIMGKNTWRSLGRALDRRTNVVLTRDADFHVPGVIVCRSIGECLDLCVAEQCFVIGGAQVFRQFLPHAQKMFITWIDHEFEGDTHFPEFDPDDWETVFFESMQSETGYLLTFQEYNRKQPAV